MTTDGKVVTITMHYRVFNVNILCRHCLKSTLDLALSEDFRYYYPIHYTPCQNKTQNSISFTQIKESSPPPATFICCSGSQAENTFENYFSCICSGVLWFWKSRSQFLTVKTRRQWRSRFPPFLYNVSLYLFPLAFIP